MVARAYIDFMGEEFIAEIDYRVTYWGCPAKLYGPPEDCYPEEPPEWEIDSIVLMWDRPGTLGAPFEATGALLDHLAQLDAINDAVCEDACEREHEWFED